MVIVGVRRSMVELIQLDLVSCRCISSTYRYLDAGLINGHVVVGTISVIKVTVGSMTELLSLSLLSRL